MAISVWMNPWRRELLALLEAVPVSRKPAFRRSLRADFLFSADLPRCASGEDCAAFRREAEKAGWIILREGDWLNLRPREICLSERFFPESLSGEVASLKSLLSRHSGSADASREAILLIKAREEGPLSWESACRALHRDLARRLRTKEPFPSLFQPEKEETD